MIYLGTAPAGAAPPIGFVAGEPRPLRDRWHLDVSRPGGVVASFAPAGGGGPYGLRHADPDGLEVDLVPGGPLPGDASDWTSVFSTTACYRVGPGAGAALVTAVAALAEDADLPLLVGVRRDAVVLESGKDQGDAAFGSLAATLQAAARDAGGVPDPSAACFVQLVLDAADVEAARSFWLAALGYVPDPRDGVTDVHDPRRLDPVVVLQALDPTETDRRAQRNRVGIELELPGDAVASRVGAAVDAGGRVESEVAGRTTMTDAEGNHLVVVAAPRRGV